MASVKNTNQVNIIIKEKFMAGVGGNVDAEFGIVLLAIDKPFTTEFTTHIHNRRDNSISDGHYFTEIEDALLDYEGRN